MNRLRWLTACVAILSAVPAPAQLALSPDVNLFGDDPPEKDWARSHEGVPGKHFFDKAPTAPEKSQVLVFCDNRKLHGKLVEVTRDEVIWRRADSKEALRFPRAVVRRIELAPTQSEEEPVSPAGMVTTSPPPGPSPAAMQATLKLPGSDWLFGKATSADGERFTLRLEDGTPVIVHRAQLEWLYFSPEPAPAFGFFGSKLDLEGWMAETSAIEVVGGTATVAEGDWIGRSMSSPERFEVTLEVPAETEDGTRLWLQPSGPRVTSYTTGTVEIQFGKRQITRQLFINNMERQTSPLPKETTAEKGPIQYHIFYDAIARRIVVQRNGCQVGDWKLDSEKGGDENQAPPGDLHVAGICLERRRGANSELKLSQLRLQPWDGVLPGNGNTRESRDQLIFEDATPITGKLQSIAAGKLIFSGESHASIAGDFVKFAATPEPLPEPEAKVHLGRQGEFNTHHLEIRDGRVHCDTAFAAALEVPVKAVQTIAFQDQPPPPAPSDLLVFKNGDELPGKALAASTDGPIRWKSVGGQELEIQSDQVAGIRFIAATEATPPAPAATVELRNGDRLRGNVVALDNERLQFQHPQLGALTLDRSRLWHLFPSPSLEISDGGRDPESWMRYVTPERHRPARKPNERSTPWIYLDGTYVLRTIGNIMSVSLDDGHVLQREIPPALGRFEVRVEASSPVAADVNLLMRLAASNAGLTWQANVSYSDVHLTVHGPPPKHHPNLYEISLQEKLPDLDSRRALRLFVDMKAGTSDLFINGVLIAHLGQQPNDRLTPGKYTVHFQPLPKSGTQCVLSNLWVGPWTGELPRAGNPPDATTALSNGDAAPGAPKGIHEGLLAMDGELGPFDIPVGKVQEVDFGGAMLPERTTGRLRLTDGAVLNVEQFQWDSRGLTAHSSTLGDLRLPAGAVDELIYHPPLHAPMNPEPKSVAQKDLSMEAATPVINP